MMRDDERGEKEMTHRKITRGDPARAGGEDFDASKGGDMPTRLSFTA